jgi:hypothetical protein
MAILFYMKQAQYLTNDGFWMDLTLLKYTRYLL